MVQSFLLQRPSGALCGSLKAAEPVLLRRFAASCATCPSRAPACRTAFGAAPSLNAGKFNARGTSVASRAQTSSTDEVEHRADLHCLRVAEGR